MMNYLLLCLTGELINLCISVVMHYKYTSDAYYSNVCLYFNNATDYFVLFRSKVWPVI